MDALIAQWMASVDVAPMPSPQNDDVESETTTSLVLFVSHPVDVTWTKYDPDEEVLGRASVLYLLASFSFLLLGLCMCMVRPRPSPHPSVAVAEAVPYVKIEERLSA